MASTGVELTVQSERAFQKQPIYQNSKVARQTTRTKRWYKDVGLGFKTPRAAIDGQYIDKKCPWTGQVSVRGRILTGRVVSTKMTRTIIIRREYLHYVPKYNRYERRHSKLPVHVSPAFRVAVGDEVIVGQTRPLSKTIRYNLLRISRSQAEKQEKVFGKF
ncbi:hypothetical protein FA10DRAFT_264899 [Acaromyces ingoldii]|uniref:Small ribosomal subunit protein uS17 N-terminal domain-containing protein n=1 Tax=Acaromyces ingoldii TaxID=215250 RepID=A0A316YZ00_9BASI|nr:hypothetical protein FA10DRAFT_264899 [Acaromyces ingoldii]PWN94362.1 hypothetical protein FA10DRAFT_264899 [Acaromyces ingoldii]